MEALSQQRREILNQLINFFWSILGVAPVFWFWYTEGINLYFYLFIAAAFMMGMLPAKILNLFTFTSNKKIYERLGVKQIRKLVQNGDAVLSSGRRKQYIIKNVAHAKQYLKTIAMYERFHWICLVFFLLTSLLCFYEGLWKLGVTITLANLLYNASSLLLQQYNKLRIKNITASVNKRPQQGFSVKFSTML